MSDSLVVGGPRTERLFVQQAKQEPIGHMRDEQGNHVHGSVSRGKQAGFRHQVSQLGVYKGQDAQYETYNDGMDQTDDDADPRPRTPQTFEDSSVENPEKSGEQEVHDRAHGKGIGTGLGEYGANQHFKVQFAQPRKAHDSQQDADENATEDAAPERTIQLHNSTIGQAASDPQIPAVTH